MMRQTLVIDKGLITRLAHWLLLNFPAKLFACLLGFAIFGCLAPDCFLFLTVQFSQLLTSAAFLCFLICTFFTSLLNISLLILFVLFLFLHILSLRPLPFTSTRVGMVSRQHRRPLSWPPLGCY